MTDITPTGGDQAIGPAAKATKAQQIAKSLAHIRANLLGPFKDWHTMYADHYGAHGGTWDSGYRGFLQLVPPSVRQPTNAEEREKAIERVIDVLTTQPEAKDVADLLARTIALADAKFDLRQTRFIIGLMVDAFPNGRMSAPDTYLESLIDEMSASDPCPGIVAHACAEVKRTATFVPALPEVIAKVESSRKVLALHIRTAERFLGRAAYCDQLLDWLRDVPLFDGDEANRQEPPREFFPCFHDEVPTGKLRSGQVAQV